LIFKGNPVFFISLSSSKQSSQQRCDGQKRAAALVRAVVAGLVVATTWLSPLGSAALAKSPDGPASVAAVPLASLPSQAQTTYQLILNGGPFPYSKDGVVFGNREKQLPTQPRGYYHEYTVKTPGARNRGARRIVCGGKPPTQPESCFYTDDHYASFRRIVK
jgi:ribonuclease T1